MTWQSSIAIISGPDDLGLFAWHWNFDHQGKPQRHRGYGTYDECMAQRKAAGREWLRVHRDELAVNGCVDY